MRKVGIVGAAITPCKGRWVERTYYGLKQMAVRECMKDASVSIKDVDAVVFGIYNDIFEINDESFINTGNWITDLLIILIHYSFHCIPFTSRMCDVF